MVFVHAMLSWSFVSLYIWVRLCLGSAAASENIAGGVFLMHCIPKVGVGSDVCNVGKACGPAYLLLYG